MKRQASYWHMLVLGFIAAVLNELTKFLIPKSLSDNTAFIVEAVKFILIVGILATLYVKVFLKDRNGKK